MHRAVQRGVVPGAKMPGDQHAGAQAYPVDKAGQQENQAARRTHGGKRFAADKVADNQRVNGIVQLLEQVAHEDRHRKQQHPFYD